MPEKIFVFKEYTQRHELRTVKYLKNPPENIMYYTKSIPIYISDKLI